MSVSASAGLVPAVSSEQDLTAAEVDQARRYLQQTHNAVVGATKGLSDAQWHYKPAPDRWSIAENLDHIVIVMERVLGPVFEQLRTAPPPPDGFDFQAIDAIVISQFSNRLSRFNAPEVVHPVDQIAPGELLERLAANYARLGACLESTPGLRQHAVEALPLKALSKGAHQFMDAYQWILAGAGHAERHAKQMLEVKAEPGFPVA